jgi:hypothetical protein
VLVALVASPDPSVRIKGEEKLVRIIKESVLKGEIDPEQATEDTFCFGHFVSPTTLDLAIGISTIPYGGVLIVPSQRNGNYVPVGTVTGIGHIESIEAVRLFSGQLDQLALNLYTGGSGLRHWGKDIYCWDGKALRMIWAWIRKEVYKDWRPGQREISGHMIQGDIAFGKVRRDGTKEIMTSTAVEKGIFGNKSWVLDSVTSKNMTKLVHIWDQSLFFYVAKYGKTLPSQVTVRCKEGIPPKEASITIEQSTRIGILDIPGFFQDRTDGLIGVIGKERFCEIPKTAVEVGR